MSDRPTPEEIAYEVAWHRKLGARTQASFANAIRAEREHYEARIAELEQSLEYARWRVGDSFVEPGPSAFVPRKEYEARIAELELAHVKRLRRTRECLRDWLDDITYVSICKELGIDLEDDHECAANPIRRDPGVICGNET